MEPIQKPWKTSPVSMHCYPSRQGRIDRRARRGSREPETFWFAPRKSSLCSSLHRTENAEPPQNLSPVQQAYNLYFFPTFKARADRIKRRSGKFCFPPQSKYKAVRTNLNTPRSGAACPVLQHTCPVALHLTAGLTSQAPFQDVSLPK